MRNLRLRLYVFRPETRLYLRLGGGAQAQAAQVGRHKTFQWTQHKTISGGTKQSSHGGHISCLGESSSNLVGAHPRKRPPHGAWPVFSVLFIHVIIIILKKYCSGLVEGVDLILRIVS